MEGLESEHGSVFSSSPGHSRDREAFRKGLAHQSYVGGITGRRAAAPKEPSTAGLFMPKKRLKRPLNNAQSRAGPTHSSVDERRKKREENDDDDDDYLKPVSPRSSAKEKERGTDRTETKKAGSRKAESKDPFANLLKTKDMLDVYDTATKLNDKKARDTTDVTYSPVKPGKSYISSNKGAPSSLSTASNRAVSSSKPRTTDSKPSKPAQPAHTKRLASSKFPTKRGPPPDMDMDSDMEHDSDSDELALGNTPPRHRSQNYKSSSRAPSSDGPYQSMSRFDQVPRQKGLHRSVLVPASEDEDVVPTPKARLKTSAGGVKRPRREDDEDDDDWRKKGRGCSNYGAGTVASKREGKTMGERDTSVEDVTPKASKTGRCRVQGKENRLEVNDNNRRQALVDASSSPLRSSPPVATMSTAKTFHGVASRVVSDSEDTEDDHIPSGAATGDKRHSASEKVVLSPEASARKAQRVSATKKGHSFFEMLEHISSSDLEEFDDDFLDGPSFVVDPLADDGEFHFIGDDDFDDEDRKWLASMMDKTNLCPYCSQPLPREPSAHHRRLKRHIDKVSTPAPTSDNPNARSLPWQQAIDFCALHRAETTIIPLGVRSGYPIDIDFATLERRVESGWIRRALDAIVRDPSASRVFMDVKRDVAEVGKMRWGNLANQAKEERLAAVKPGYYGEIGRIILTDHFHKLRKWKYLLPSIPPAQPGSDIPDDMVLPIDPLSPNDFITSVLVPEASVFLIMDDRGCTELSPEGYEEAQKTRLESVKYGDWKFNEGDKRLKRILAEIRQGQEEKRRRLAKLYGKKKKGVEEEEEEKKSLVDWDSEAERGQSSQILEVDGSPLPKNVQIRRKPQRGPPSSYDDAWDADDWRQAALDVA